MRRLLTMTGTAALAAVFGLAAACAGDPEPGPTRHAAQVPQTTTPSGTLTDWLQVCGTADTYPCPPYGITRFDTLANTVLVPGNNAARVFVEQDGVYDLSTYYAGGADGLFVFVSAGW